MQSPKRTAYAGKRPNICFEFTLANRRRENDFVDLSFRQSRPAKKGNECFGIFAPTAVDVVEVLAIPDAEEAPLRGL